MGSGDSTMVWPNYKHSLEWESNPHHDVLYQLSYRGIQNNFVFDRVSISDGTRTRNLKIRSLTPRPLGHEGTISLGD